MTVIDTPYAFAGRFELSRVFVGPSGDSSGNIDLATINGALAKTGKVELGPGDFYINSAIIINRSKTIIVGQGREITRINFVGSLATHNMLLVSSSATTSNDGTATPLTATAAITDVRVEGMSFIGTNSVTVGGLTEEKGNGIYLIGTKRCRVVDVAVSGFITFGISTRSGLATGDDNLSSRDNIITDCIVLCHGAIGYYDDSVNTFGVGGGTNPTPNRNNRFEHCTAYRTTKYADFSGFVAAGFSTYGTWGAKYTDCHAEGFQSVTTGLDCAGFLDQGNAWGSEYTDCTTVECFSGILVASANHIKIHGFHSWFDANFGIKVGPCADLVVEEASFTDTGAFGIYSGVGIYIHGTQSPGGTVKRCIFRDISFGVTGITTTPIFGIAGANIPANPFKWDSNTENAANLFTEILIDRARSTGWSGNLINNIVAGTLIHNMTVKNCPGFNPLGLLALPFDNTNNFIGFPGVSATLTSAKVYTCTVAPIDINWTGGTVTSQTKNGVAIPQAVGSPNTIHLEPGDTFSITFSVTPTTFDVYQE